MIELSKKEKKIARALISACIEKEFETALSQADDVLLKWKQSNLTGREAFHKLRDHLNQFRKHLSSRYDYLKGSTYLLTVTTLLKEGYLTEADVQEFSAETKAQIKRWIQSWEE